jgi:hypothetical protein
LPLHSSGYNRQSSYASWSNHHLTPYDPWTSVSPFFNSEDGGKMFLWNVHTRPEDYMSQQPRRP